MKYLFIILSFFLFVACGSNGGSSGTVDNEEEAMEMLESNFSGPYSKVAIKKKLDTVLTMYRMEISKENYLKAGNSLVSLTKQGTGFTEVDIINDMLLANTGAKGVSFDEQASTSVKKLQARIAENQ